LNVGIRQPYLRVIGIQIDTDLSNATNLKTGSNFLASRAEEEEEFRRLSRTPNVYETLSKAIAPSIFGFNDIKKAIACLLFGGSRKR
jgi:DNA replication licensing factor MCM5